MMTSEAENQIWRKFTDRAVISVLTNVCFVRADRLDARPGPAAMQQIVRSLSHRSGIEAANGNLVYLHAGSRALGNLRLSLAEAGCDPDDSIASGAGMANSVVRYRPTLSSNGSQWTVRPGLTNIGNNFPFAPLVARASLLTRRSDSASHRLAMLTNLAMDWLEQVSSNPERSDPEFVKTGLPGNGLNAQTAAFSAGYDPASVAGIEIEARDNRWWWNLASIEATPEPGLRIAIPSSASELDTRAQRPAVSRGDSIHGGAISAVAAWAVAQVAHPPGAMLQGAPDWIGLATRAAPRTEESMLPSELASAFASMTYVEMCRRVSTFGERSRRFSHQDFGSGRLLQSAIDQVVDCLNIVHPLRLASSDVLIRRNGSADPARTETLVLELGRRGQDNALRMTFDESGVEVIRTSDARRHFYPDPTPQLVQGVQAELPITIHATR